MVRRSSRSPCGQAARRDRPSRPPVSLQLHQLFVRRRPLVDPQANHRRRQRRRRIRNGAQHQNRWYAYAAMFFREMTPFPRNDPLPTLPGRKLACPRGGRLRNGLRDVEVARPSPSHRQQTTRFSPPLFQSSRKIRLFFGAAWPCSRLLGRACMTKALISCAKMNLRFFKKK